MVVIGRRAEAKFRTPLCLAGCRVAGKECEMKLNGSTWYAVIMAIQRTVAVLAVVSGRW